MIFAECHPERKHDAHGLCAICARKARRITFKLNGYPHWVTNRGSLQNEDRHLQYRKLWQSNNLDRHAEAQARYREKMKELYGARADTNPIARARWAIDKNEKREAQRKRISQMDKDGSSGPHFKTICELLRKGQWTREA